ncbi:hypothetical protein P692DRAFT_20836540 [Suillus brevipes Sb2]|nr:hypothetical protein P692DRAFT_20836540 [Suillus brevipes Sb2]
MSLPSWSLHHMFLLSDTHYPSETAKSQCLLDDLERLTLQSTTERLHSRSERPRTTQKISYNNRQLENHSLRSPLRGLTYD